MPRDRTTRKLYNRPDDRRQNDPSDDGWAIVGPMPPKRGKMGRPRGEPAVGVRRWPVHIFHRPPVAGVTHRYPPYSTDRNRFHARRPSGPPGMSRLPAGPRPTVRGALAGSDRRRHRRPVGEDLRERRTPRPPRGREGEGPEAARRGGRRANAGHRHGPCGRHPGPGRRAGCHREVAGDGPGRMQTPGRRWPPRPEAARTP